eukprot:scaffold15771_cov27-Tisochrysis_lutea.AAC.3
MGCKKATAMNKHGAWHTCVISKNGCLHTLHFWMRASSLVALLAEDRRLFPPPGIARTGEAASSPGAIPLRRVARRRTSNCCPCASKLASLASSSFQARTSLAFDRPPCGPPRRSSPTLPPSRPLPLPSPSDDASLSESASITPDAAKARASR